MTSSQNVFGAGLSVGLGYTFNPIEFIKRPTTILRFASWIFSIVVFGCISSGCYVDSQCIFGLDYNACGYGVFVGVVAFLGCIGFLVLDALFEQLSSVQHRKYVILADIAFSSALTFLYFVAFCYLTNRLVNTPEIVLLTLSVQRWQVNNARASVSFCFFSICSFGILIFFAVQKFRLGQQDAFPSSAQIESQVASGDSQYQGGPPRPESGFQEQPFSGGPYNSGDLSDGNSERYKPPTY